MAISRNTRISITFWCAIIVVIVAFTFTLISFRTSYNQQIVTTSNQASEAIIDKIQGYQTSIENAVIDFTAHINLSVPQKNGLNPFIQLISYPNQNGEIVKTNFAQDSILIVDDKSKRLPFTSVICNNEGFWIKSSLANELGNIEYAYKLDYLINHTNSNKTNTLYFVLNTKNIFGAGDKTIRNSISSKWDEDWFVFEESGVTYSALTNADLVRSDNSTIGKIIVVTDVSTLKLSYTKIQYGLLVLGVILLLVIVFSVFFWLNHLLQNKKKTLTIENLKGEGISKYLGNNEIKQVFNATANGVRIINTNFDVIAVNDSFCRISGLQNDQIEGQKCYTVFHGIYCHTANCPLERLKNGDLKIESNEFRFKKDGKRVRCIYNATPLFDTDNQLIGIVEDFKDISEKHAVEETLKQTEKQFEVFMDNLPLGVFIEDGITHEVLYQNTYLQSITGGRSIKTFLPLESNEKLAKSYIESEEENQLLDINGNWRYFLTHKFKFLGVNNQLKIGGVMIDITKKKEVEQYRDVLSNALENSPVSVAILSPDTEIEFINPSFSSVTGYNIEEIYSKEILSLNIEYNSGNNLQKAVDSVKNGKIWQGEIHLKNRDADHFWVSASFTPIVNENGQVQHTVAIMENITKRKEYEKEILLAKSKAEESDKLKSAFLSNLSHEIRTPLNAIIGFSSLLSDNDLSFGERRNISEIIYRNSNDLLRLIENLIEISEIETGQLIIKKKEFSVNSMMSDLYRQLIEDDKKASSVKLSLRKEVHGDDLVILSDQTRLQQVLFQLLSNSCKFTENGFIEFGYSLKDESTLMFYVVDSGIGIEPEKQSLVFNPFRQVDDSNTRRYGGMGLGLAISKHIVEKLGGKIWINSTPKSGTSVYFTVPFIPVNSKFETDNQMFAKQNFKWFNKTILVADDIDANYVFLKAALKKTNANVIWAKNGTEAVDFVKQNSDINLILMDLVMPELDGFEATRIIKNINNQIPIIGQTAYPSQKNFSFAKEVGFDSMLEKPIKVNRMLMELDKYLSN